MNRILAFILLFLLGWAVSFIFDNVIITVVVCLIAGVLLFRKKKVKAIPALQATQAPPQTRSLSRSYQPQEIVDKFRALQAGDKAIYMPIFYDTLIRDQWGRYWSLGIVDLKWQRFENNTWVKEEPTGPLWMSRRSDAFFHS